MNKHQKTYISLVLNKLIFKKEIFFLVLILLSLSLTGQKIVINADQRPLNEVFFQIIEDYNLQLSYNDRQLARETITLHKEFESPEEALSYLLKSVPYEFVIQNNVFIVFRSKDITRSFSGVVYDKRTHETLPFSHVILNEEGQVTHVNGSFFFHTSDSIFHLTTSYLGYYIIDTVIYEAGRHDLYLQPSYTNLSEVIIRGEKVEYSTEIGDSPGKIRLNHKTASRLPGNGDNSVFNFLRLKPGILASGEQSSDLIIWGGYTSHSKVLFDGFTLFGLKNFNDNIGAINPYMVKDILVLKGGYGAEYGERVGGIVDITGIGGNKNAPTLNMNINNMTMSGMASVPVKKDAALMIAFRRTYYNLYDQEDIQLPLLRGNQASSDISTYPDYTFGDFNIKYAGESEKLGSYFLSLYRGKDNFSYTVNQERDLLAIQQEAQEDSRQQGGGVNWSKQWSNGINSRLSASYSDLKKHFFRSDEVIRIRNQLQVFSRESNTQNSVNEASLHGDLQMPLLSGQFSAGLEYRYNMVYLEEQIDSGTPQIHQENTGRFSGYLTDRMTLLDHFIVEPGLRIDLPLNHTKVYFQPRLTVTAELSNTWKTYLAWGVYNQLISQTSVLDDYGNYQYFWAIADNDEIPALHSLHNVGGLSYHSGDLTFSAEAYYKTSSGLTRYVSLLRENIKDVFEGNSRAYGLDLFVKKKFRKHEGWLSYSLSKTEEYFEYYPDLLFRPAAHDQRHEIKTAVLLNFKPFYISANYVYGSGFINRPTLNLLVEPERFPYSRFDAAVIYRFGLDRYHFEAGISVLNVFNTENIKISNFIRVPSDQLTSINIHAEAVPFTPAIYLNLSF